jgi:hypothetical protein
MFVEEMSQESGSETEEEQMDDQEEHSAEFVTFPGGVDDRYTGHFAFMSVVTGVETITEFLERTHVDQPESSLEHIQQLRSITPEQVSDSSGSDDSEDDWGMRARVAGISKTDLAPIVPS